MRALSRTGNTIETILTFHVEEGDHVTEFLDMFSQMLLAGDLV